METSTNPSNPSDGARPTGTEPAIKASSTLESPRTEVESNVEDAPRDEISVTDLSAPIATFLRSPRKSERSTMKTREIILLLFLIDMMILNLSFVFAAFQHYEVGFYGIEITRTTFLLLNFSWIFTYLFFLSGDPVKKEALFARIKGHSVKFIFFISLASILAMILNIDGISRITFFGTIAYFFILSFLFSNILLSYLRIKRSKVFNFSTNLIVGVSKTGDHIKKYFDSNPELGTVIGFLDDNAASSNNRKILGKVDEFQAVFNQQPFNQLIIALPLTNKERIKALISIAEYNGVRPRVIPNYYSLFNRSFEMQFLDKIPIINIREFPLNRYVNKFWKRAFDIVASSFGLLLAAPIMLLVALAIKIESKGPVFYKPVRLGRRGTQFHLYKFRSMKENDDEHAGTQSTAKNDSRITRVGKFIRRNNLDELPQLINVLEHDMSLIGPRPHRIMLNKTLQEKTSSYMVRHYVLPGITGWAQVNGWRGPTNTRKQSKARTLHDLWYIEHWTFALDMYILFLTFFGRKVKSNAF